MEYSILINACKQNDRKAQLTIYNLFKDSLLNTSYRIVKSESDAQDIVHDSIIKAFKSINHLDETANLKAWLKRIVINTSLDVIRRRKNIEWFDTALIPEDKGNKNFDVSAITVSQITNAINQLKDKYRIIVVLHLIEGLKHHEIADHLSINESTVRNQYSRGRKQLSAALKKHLKMSLEKHIIENAHHLDSKKMSPAADKLFEKRLKNEVRRISGSKAPIWKWMIAASAFLCISVATVFINKNRKD